MNVPSQSTKRTTDSKLRQRVCRGTPHRKPDLPELSSSLLEIPSILKRAFWIWPDNFGWDLVNCYALFRKAFSLKSVPEIAPFYITADQSYQLYVNGLYVCRGPARGYQRSWPFDEINLRQWLRKGRNVIAVRAYNPGRSNFQYVHQGYAGFLAAAEWPGVTILTDKTWKCRRQRGINRDTVQTSLQLFPQEDIDLRAEDPRWIQIDYREDADWSPREVSTCVWNSMPWSGLESRTIPMLDESIITAKECIGESNGRSILNWRTVRNIAISRFSEGLAHHPTSQTLEKPTFSPSRTGRWRSLLIDFGKVVVGSVILRVANAKGGEAIETFHAETLQADSLTPDFLPEDHCRMAFSHRMICRPGDQEHQFYHTFGFRYMVLTVRENKVPLTVEVSLRQTLYPHAKRGSFNSSKLQLKRIWDACAWTQQICSIDAYVDTPWREQAQWWGDARVQAWNTFHLSGDPRLLRRGIRQIGSQTAPAGVTYGHAPTMAHNCILPDFTLIWMTTLWDDYWQTGSLELFISQQDVLQTTLSYFQKWTDPESGLLRYDKRFWLFLDWTEIQKEGSSTVYNLWLLYALDRLAKLYHLTKQDRFYSECRLWAFRLRKTLLKFEQPHGLFADGILPDGGMNSHCSVHSQTLALMNRLSPKSEQTLLEKSLLPLVRGTFEPNITPSAYWITYVYTELATRGYGREVVSHIEKRWAGMAEYGSTFEGFRSIPGKESHSHAWSAHPLFHLMQILGGIRQTAAAWNQVSFSPLFEGQFAEVTVPSPHGDIHSVWERTRPLHVRGYLTLPAGIQATVALSGKENLSVVGPCRHQFSLEIPE